MSDFCHFLKSSSHSSHSPSPSGSGSDSTRRAMHRLLMVSSKSLGRVVSMNMVVSGGGSSRVFKKALADSAFILSAS